MHLRQSSAKADDCGDAGTLGTSKKNEQTTNAYKKRKGFLIKILSPSKKRCIRRNGLHNNPLTHNDF